MTTGFANVLTKVPVSNDRHLVIEKSIPPNVDDKVSNELMDGQVDCSRSSDEAIAMSSR